MADMSLVAEGPGAEQEVVDHNEGFVVVGLGRHIGEDSSETAVGVAAAGAGHTAAQVGAFAGRREEQGNPDNLYQYQVGALVCHNKDEAGLVVASYLDVLMLGTAGELLVGNYQVTDQEVLFGSVGKAQVGQGHTQAVADYTSL